MRRRWTSFFVALTLLIMLFVGCGGKEKKADFYLYYLDIDYTGIVPVEYEMQAQDANGQILEALDMLGTETKNVKYTKTIPADVTVEDYLLDQGTLSVYFNVEYKELETFTEVMVRSAIVKTLIQIPGVEAVVFFVAGNPLQDSAGHLVGAMDQNFFVDDFGQETESLLSATLVLYYASADGQSLVREEKEVYYSSNVPMERLVLDYLMKKPDTDGAQSVFPSNTKVLSVSVTDGVCYVSLDSTFLNQTGNIAENVAIYSIVNSLTELDQVGKVQITFSGKDNQMILGKYQDLIENRIYEKDTSLVNQVQESTSEESESEEEEELE